jgi:hypothetical protein
MREVIGQQLQRDVAPAYVRASAASIARRVKTGIIARRYS